MNDALFPSKNKDWITPQEFFEKYNREYNFQLDVCASKENAKCARYFDKQIDGLKQVWSPYVCWMNPPYGRGIGLWIKKAYDESLAEAVVVCLLPARNDTKWFHDFVLKAETLEFIKGRLKFGDSKNNAPFPSLIAVFRTPRVYGT